LNTRILLGFLTEKSANIAGQCSGGPGLVVGSGRSNDLCRGAEQTFGPLIHEWNQSQDPSQTFLEALGSKTFGGPPRQSLECT
jgi:hypothetical protein